LEGINQNKTVTVAKRNETRFQCRNFHYKCCGC